MCLRNVSCIRSTFLSEGFVCLVVTGGNEGQCEASEENQSRRT